LLLKALGNHLKKIFRQLGLPLQLLQDRFHRLTKPRRILPPSRQRLGQACGDLGIAGIQALDLFTQKTMTTAVRLMEMDQVPGRKTPMTVRILLGFFQSKAGCSSSSLTRFSPHPGAATLYGKPLFNHLRIVLPVRVELLQGAVALFVKRGID